MRRIIISYRILLLFLSYFIVLQSLWPNAILLIATSWICIILSLTVYLGRYSVADLYKKDLLNEGLTLLLLSISAFIRADGGLEAFFIEISLIHFISIVLGIIISLIIYRANISSFGSGYGKKVAAIIIIGIPAFVFIKYYMEVYTDEMNISQNPISLVIFLGAMIPAIVNEIKFAKKLQLGQARFDRNIIRKKKWLLILLIALWAVLMPYMFYLNNT